MSPNAARILVVDDDRAHADALADALRATGHQVSVAGTVDAAFLILPTELPDLAILEMNMPGACGLKVAALIRDQFGVPIVFLTRIHDEDTVIQATAVGALAYLVKNGDLHHYLPTLEAVLARAAELRKLRESEANLSLALQQGRETSMAVGILMERHRVDRETAFRILRDNARTRRQRVHEMSAQLLESAEQLNELGRAGSPKRHRDSAPRGGAGHE